MVCDRTEQKTIVAHQNDVDDDDEDDDYDYDDRNHDTNDINYGYYGNLRWRP